MSPKMSERIAQMRTRNLRPELTALVGVSPEAFEQASFCGLAVSVILGALHFPIGPVMLLI